MAIDALTVGAIAFGGGGIVGGVITLLRFPSDKSKVVVETAQGAVVVQKGVIDSLTMEIARLNTECADKDEQLDAKDRVIHSLENIIAAIDDRQSEERRKAGIEKLLQPPQGDDDGHSSS